MRQINEVDLFSFDLLASFVVRFNQIVNDSTKKLRALLETSEIIDEAYWKER